MAREARRHRRGRPGGAGGSQAAGVRGPHRAQGRRRLPPRLRLASDRAGPRADDDRHRLRPRFAHQGRRHDDQRDGAGGARTGGARRAGGALPPRVRAQRQVRDHGAPAHDARGGPPPGHAVQQLRSRARRRDALRLRHPRAGAGGDAVRLQRRRFHGARRDGPACERVRSGGVRAAKHLRAAADDRDLLPPSRGAARARRAHRDARRALDAR